MMRKRRRAIEKIGKKQELHKAGIVTTKIQQRSHCTLFRWSEAKMQGESSSSVASLRQQAGTRKKWQGKSRRRQQVSSSRPGETPSAYQHSIVRNLMADAFLFFFMRNLLSET